MGFPRQEYWSELLFPPPGDLSDPWEIKISAWQANSLSLSHQGSPTINLPLDYFREDPRYYTISFIAISVCIFKR